MSLSKIKDVSKLRHLLDAVLVVERDLSLTVVLKTLVRESATLVNARYGALGVLDPSGTSLVEFITFGMDETDESKIGDRPKGHGVLGLLISQSQPLRIDELQKHPDSFGFPPLHPRMTSFLGLPIMVGERNFGNLYLTNKIDNSEFDQEDEILAGYLARAAGIAIENARLHSAVADFALRADRERIARELHDEIIQRLFAIGLSLQATIRLVAEEDANERIQGAIDDLDEAIKKIRATIFALETTRTRQQYSFRAQVLALTKELHPVLGFEASVSFTGPIDTMVTNKLATNGLSVLREAISNIAKHSRASQVQISISASNQLVIVVEDNGVGLDPSGSAASKGLKNMAARAFELGGTLELRPSQTLKGACLEWRVPFLQVDDLATQ
ncbi:MULTISPECIES: GAF domain-containing sensor histidine kinase [Acidithrix]|uniref:Hypoxia sensor histidine kinase response regulator DosT n=1 Tax=Acidithrix ferrooxidans TaxID=1280514 RepID=A0A0D8HMN4_9ACTN|nr:MULTISPECIES: GAF domain-containing sensor histidine kinase [Acidithrix]KJF18331.1 hypoxia sensor histidine kinase response regulator DosT [Acidithrix ferrooxidans]CAG4921189.1 unnamed protein product [Acidithrix sp. C25]